MNWKLAFVVLAWISFGIHIGHDIVYGYHEDHNNEMSHHIPIHDHEHDDLDHEHSCSIDLGLHVFVPASIQDYKFDLPDFFVLLLFEDQITDLFPCQGNQLFYSRKVPELPQASWLRNPKLRGPPMA